MKKKKKNADRNFYMVLFFVCLRDHAKKIFHENRLICSNYNSVDGMCVYACDVVSVFHC